MMRFEIGKVYRHTTGHIIKIIGAVQSTMYGGLVLVAEQSNSSDFLPVGSGEDATANYELVGDDVWESLFS